MRRFGRGLFDLLATPFTSCEFSKKRETGWVRFALEGLPDSDYLDHPEADYPGVHSTPIFYTAAKALIKVRISWYKFILRARNFHVTTKCADFNWLNQIEFFGMPKAKQGFVIPGPKTREDLRESIEILRHLVDGSELSGFYNHMCVWLDTAQAVQTFLWNTKALRHPHSCTTRYRTLKWTWV